MSNLINRLSQLRLTSFLEYVTGKRNLLNRSAKCSVLIVLLFSCSNPDGKYIIYSAEPITFRLGEEEGFDYDASQLLCQKMLGRRFEMKYNQDFIIMKDGAPEVVFQRVVDGNDTTFNNTRQDGDKTIEYKLYMNPKRESNTLIATAKWTINEIDSTGNFSQRTGRIARASCQIKKYEKN